MAFRIGASKKVGGVYVGASTNVGGKKSSSKAGCGTWLIVIVVAICLFSFISKDTEDVEPTAEPTATVEPTVEPTLEPTIEPTIQPTLEPTEEPTEEIEEETEVIVYVTSTGSKYHNDCDCSGMNNPLELTLDEAIAQGYEPCSKCY